MEGHEEKAHQSHREQAQHDIAGGKGVVGRCEDGDDEQRAADLAQGIGEHQQAVRASALPFGNLLRRDGLIPADLHVLPYI